MAKKQDGESEVGPREPSKSPTIVVGTALDNPHPSVALTRKCCEKTAPSEEDGLLWPVDVRRLNLVVSEKLLLRGLLLFDALVKALEALKTPVIMGRGEKCRTYVKRDGEEIEIRLKETSARKPRTSFTAKERAEIKERPGRHFVRMTELRPTGKLMITLECRGHEKTRKDDPRYRLEDRLDSIVELIPKLAREVKEFWAERARRNVESEQRRKKELEQREELVREQGRVEWFNRQFEAWKEADRIRAFAAEIREESARRSIVIEPGSWLANWLAWMERRADSVDPIPGLLKPRT
jgi:hypothetical protein